MSYPDADKTWSEEDLSALLDKAISLGLKDGMPDEILSNMTVRDIEKFVKIKQ